MRRQCTAFGLILWLLFASGIPVHANTVPESDKQLQAASHPDLAIEKLRQEIHKLELENQNLDSAWGRLGPFVSLLTALGAVAGVLVTVWKQGAEQRRQRELDREQREKEAQQRAEESRRRLDEEFTSVVAQLASDNARMQTSAAVSITTFLKEEHQAFHDKVLRILLAYLKLEQSPSLYRLLGEAFEEAIRRQLPVLRAGNPKYAPDLARTNLARADLSELDLRYADVGFANLQGANLTGAKLDYALGIEANLEKARLSRAHFLEARFQKAHCAKAQFHDANLVSADWKESDLREAEFYRASLQAAHFDQANLTGAKFQEANLSDTFFIGAVLDDRALESIWKARNWRNAHFDEATKARLEALAAKHDQAGK